METGIKALDKLLTAQGIITSPGSTGFQSVTELRPADPKVVDLKLPFCMYQKVMMLPAGRRVRYHHFYMQHRQCRLASYLVNEEGDIVEQVFFQRDVKSVAACKKLAMMIRKRYKVQEKEAA